MHDRFSVNDKQSDEQMKEAEWVTKAGELYHVAKNMESFLEWWKQTFN